MKSISVFVLLSGIVSLSFGKSDFTVSNGVAGGAQIEVFTFTSGGAEIEGKIYLPASFSRSNDHPSIFLIDFTEQHFAVAKDEFEKLIEAAEKIQGLNAVVVTLKDHLDVSATTSDVQTYYDIFKDMAAYVEANYTSNTSRTFVGRGREGGLVMAIMFLEDPATSIFDNFMATDSPSVLSIL